MQQDFETLITEAEAQPFVGWDFAFLRGRWEEHDPSWQYEAVVAEKLKQAQSLLDMGTGGGEFLASLQPLPPHTCATEAYAPNVEVARARLAPLGVEVAAITDDETLPFADATFDLVINRHESFSAREVRRILKPGGLFISQQVGGEDNQDLNRWLQAETSEYSAWSLAVARGQLETAGMEITDAREEFPETRFYDIGAVVYYLKVIEWQVPDFSVAKYLHRLRAMHELIEQQGYFPTRAHRFLVQARTR